MFVVATYIDGSVEQTNVKYDLDKYRSELG